MTPLEDHQEDTMTNTFTASNGLVVTPMGVNRYRVSNAGAASVERGFIQGESTLRALVEYAASIGIVAPGEEKSA